MNQNQFIARLSELLDRIRYFPALISELSDILSQSGREKVFFRLLINRLQQLNTCGINAVMLEEFENLGNELYSMHLSSSGFNIRILYSFLPNCDPVLLLAFYERGGKKKTDYTPYIGPALSRLSEVKGSYYNEKH